MNSPHLHVLKLVNSPGTIGEMIDMIDTGGTDFSTVFFQTSSKSRYLEQLQDPAVRVKSTRVSKKHHTESRDLESFVVEENFPKFSQLQ